MTFVVIENAISFVFCVLGANISQFSKCFHLIIRSRLQLSVKTRVYILLNCNKNHIFLYKITQIINLNVKLNWIFGLNSFRFSLLRINCMNEPGKLLVNIRTCHLQTQGISVFVHRIIPCYFSDTLVLSHRRPGFESG